MFGANLRHLASAYPSISELARQLDINRTQFNRYLSGESFPRPDILSRICDFFDVDARVLLEPVEELRTTRSGLSGPELSAFFGPMAMNVSEDKCPSGFYLFSRRSFMENQQFVLGVVRIWRDASGDCLVRGFEPREAMRKQGLPLIQELREFRGLVMTFENGLAMLITRRKALTGSFNFVTRVPSFENNFWAGYIARTLPESAVTMVNTRLVYEYLGPTVQDALPAARRSGFADRDSLPSFHHHLLQPDTPMR